MRRATHRVAPLGILVAALWAAATPASASARCVRAGERALASSPQLVLVAPSTSPTAVRLVCRRASGTRRPLARLGSPCSHCVSSIRRVVLRGRFAYAVVSHRTFNDQQAELQTLDTSTWRTRRAPVDLADQADDLRTDVSDLLALPRGRAVMRARNDFAAAIVLTGPDGAAVLDEGLASAIGAPKVRGGRVSWRHGAALRSSPARPADRCPRAPAAGTPSRPGAGGMLATADAVTSGSWYCVQATGATGHVDGTVIRLLGSLAVVQRPADVRVVDLRTAATIAGPAAADAHARNNPTVGSSGTLVLRRPGACAGDAEIVALEAGMPERRLACGDLRDLRYVDGIVRWRDQATGVIARATVA